MKVTTLVLKIIALALAAAAAICAIIAYWDRLIELTDSGRQHFYDRMASSEYDDYEE
ncbi:MAG: hypothetical protein R3Y07_01740 [Eubacteriales bacterium]